MRKMQGKIKILMRRRRRRRRLKVVQVSGERLAINGGYGVPQT
jgi:hypothetical protein